MHKIGHEKYNIDFSHKHPKPAQTPVHTATAFICGCLQEFVLSASCTHMEWATSELVNIKDPKQFHKELTAFVRLDQLLAIHRRYRPNAMAPKTTTLKLNFGAVTRLRGTTLLDLTLALKNSIHH